ncbi:unnamed protein product [Prorocentrum cordatum]|uniref:Uncharacterized protein n=1 Tax=Prorocentrum cordatum TaxID=2364126 RepID=A0ABN9V8C2_9DINO|nr:unnamed protein product [Polarella glacialis]
MGHLSLSVLDRRGLSLARPDAASSAPLGSFRDKSPRRPTAPASIASGSGGKVLITIVSATDLMAADSNGKSDPYCKCRVRGVPPSPRPASAMQLARALTAAVALLAAAVQGAGNQATSSLRLDEAAPSRPVSKVITLLKDDMLKQLESEAERDEEIYDKMACWCETNEKEKTASIKAAEERIAQLEAKIEEDAALSVKLESEMRELEAEVAKNQAALDKATSIREHELADFNAEEKELLEAITALKSAVTVLSKHHSAAAFLQLPGQHAAEGVASTLRRVFAGHGDRLQGVLTRSERRVAAAFIQSPQDDYFDAEPTFKQSYAPQSGEIFGILEQMKEAAMGLIGYK